VFDENCDFGFLVNKLLSVTLFKLDELSMTKYSFCLYNVIIAPEIEKYVTTT